MTKLDDLHFVSFDIEFVKDDRPEQFLENAATLKRWLAQWQA